MAEQKKIRVRPHIDRKPVASDITAAEISQLVDRFYDEIRKDARLGPIFEARVQGNWDPHLAKMKKFWRSVLLKTSEYYGAPMPVHMSIEGVQSDDFGHWLDLFRPVARDVFSSEAAPVVIATAERIARSLWMGRFATLENSHPSWAAQPGDD